MAGNIINKLKLPSGGSGSVKASMNWYEYSGYMKAPFYTKLSNITNSSYITTGIRVECSEIDDDYDWLEEALNDSKNVNSQVLSLEGLVLLDNTGKTIPVILEPLGANFAEPGSDAKVWVSFIVHPITGQSYSSYIESSYRIHASLKLHYVTVE